MFQEPALIGGIPLYENLFLGHETAFSKLGIVSHTRMIREAKRIVEEFGIHVDVTRLTSEFSYSVRQAAEAVKATVVPDALDLPRAFVLFDEPTAALSHEEVPHLLALVKQLATRGLGVAFVSHRLKEVLEVCRDIVVLKDGAVTAQTTADSTDEAALHALMVGRVRQADFHAEDRQGSGLRDRIVLSVRGAGCRDRAQHIAPTRSVSSSRTSASICAKARFWASRASLAPASRHLLAAWPARIAWMRAR